MNLWIDMANAPQVLFFSPLLAEFHSLGHHASVTVRNYGFASALASRYQIPHVLIGRHGGRQLAALVYHLAKRTVALARWARKQKFDLAISHNSYAQAVAATMLGVPFVTLMDYEHQPLNHLAFRLARRVVVPQPFPEDRLRYYGGAQKAVHYHGIKEEVYLSCFQPSADFRKREEIPEDAVLVVVRPPASWAAYHRFENDIFDAVLRRLARSDAVYLLALPRLESQARKMAQSGLHNVHIASHAYDGPDLIYHADLVVSAGGTMNREAAVLGTPAYSIFKGHPSAVDAYLEERGRLVHIGSESEMDSIRIERRPANGRSVCRHDLATEVTNLILEGALP